VAKTPTRKRVGRSAKKVRGTASGFAWSAPSAVAGAELSPRTEEGLQREFRTIEAAQMRARAGASTYYLG
jgi:hypothetical protein